MSKTKPFCLSFFFVLGVIAVLEIATTLEAAQLGEPGRAPAIGDVDFDGVLTQTDAEIVAAVASGSAPLICSEQCMDYDGDGKITVGDALKIAQVVNEAPTHAVPAPHRQFEYGDLDGDGSISLNDVSILAVMLTGAGIPDIPAMEAGDLNENGSIDVGDLDLFLRRLGFFE